VILGELVCSVCSRLLPLLLLSWRRARLRRFRALRCPSYPLKTKELFVEVLQCLKESAC